MLVQCHICSLLVEANFLNSHFKYLHKHEGLPRYRCMMPTCDRFFTNKRSFRKHVESHADSASQFQIELEEDIRVSVGTIDDNMSSTKFNICNSLGENINAGNHAGASNDNFNLKMQPHLDAQNCDRGSCIEPPVRDSDSQIQIELDPVIPVSLKSIDDDIPLKKKKNCNSLGKNSNPETLVDHPDSQLQVELDEVIPESDRISYQTESVQNNLFTTLGKNSSMESHTEPLSYSNFKLQALLDKPNTPICLRTTENIVSARSEIFPTIDEHFNSGFQLKYSGECSSRNSQSNNVESLKQKASALILRFSADPSLSRIQVQRIVEAFHQFLNNDEMNEFKNNLVDLVSPENKENAEDRFSKFQGIFCDIDSEYKRLQKLESDGYYIPPISNFIGTTEVSRPNGTMVTKEFYCQYVPIKKTLKSYLENNRNFNEIYTYFCNLKKDDDNIENIIQSQFWKNKTLGTEKIVFPLFLYQDDFETGNPLGSRAGIHKLCGMYMTIGCLPPEFRSKLVNIFLVLLCHAADIKKYDNSIIYGQLIKDLNDLESNGIRLQLDNTTVVVYFKLAVIIGDNLGLNSTLGFTESFSAKFSCRLCKAAKNQSREFCSESRCVLRNRNNYETDLSRNSLSDTGIQKLCVWNRVTDFHAVENHCVDIMHDLLEGVCKIEIAGLLNYAIGRKKYFTLETLNERIKYFERSVTSNAPPLISHNDLSQSRIKMTASEMKAFMLNAGIIFGDLIKLENDKYWRLYRLLRNILCICLQSSVSIDTASRLEILIEEHHRLYIELNGKTLKPKHHHMLHYGRIMREIGPLRHVWAMRFEAKHRPSKKNAVVSCSRVNISKTLAIQHQLYFANALIKREFLSNDITCETLKNVPLESFPTIRSLPTDFSQYIVVKKLMIGNTSFQVNDVIRVQDIPIFGQIERICINRHKVQSPEVSDFVFIIKVLEIVNYNNHYQAHIVAATDTLDVLVSKRNKKLTKVCVILMSDGNKYIVYD